MNSGKIVLGILAGFAAGAILGILLAPDKGSNTRQKIVDMKNDMTDKVKAKFDELAHTVTDSLKKDKRAAEKIVSKVQSITEEVKQEAMNGIG